MSKIKSDDLIRESIENVRKDRNQAIALLTHLVQGAKDDFSKNVAIAADAAKVIETLQKSNEQLVKLATLLYKETKLEDLQMNEDDLADIYAERQKNAG